jgi:hypothetical protein
VVFDGPQAVTDPRNVQFRWLMAEEEDVNTGEEWLAGSVQDPQDCAPNADGDIECSVTFIPGDAEVDNLLRVEVTFLDDDGVLRSIKSPATTEMVVNVQDAPIVPVLSTTSPVVGQVVRASGLQDEDGLSEAGESLQWIWQTSSTGAPNGTWTDVATNPYNVTGFVPLAEHAGRYLRVVASYTDDHGTAERAASLPTSNPVAAQGVPGPQTPSAPFSNTASVEGQSIRVSWTAPVDNGGSAISGYRVTVRANGGVVSTRAAGVGATSLLIGGLDTDPTIAYTFTVAATNAAGTGAASQVMGPVSFPAPVAQPPVVQSPVAPPPVAQPPVALPTVVTLDGTPRLVGKRTIGTRLRVRLPEVTSPGAAKVKITWKANGKKIKGAKGWSYRVRTADRGKKIHVVLRISQRGLAPIKVTTRTVKIKR